jgi:hypothetical protein
MVSGIGCNHSDAYKMPTLSKKEEQLQQQTKNGYWQNELHSLRISELKQKKEPNGKEELENLADFIKQSMFQDYKLAYSKKGDVYKEEVRATLAVG